MGSTAESSTITSENKRPRTDSSASLTSVSSKEARPIVESSAIFSKEDEDMTMKRDNKDEQMDGTTTLLLFYQYVEPPWSDAEYKQALKTVEVLGQQAQITGRMRVAKEGLNCTLTGTHHGILTFCRSLRRWKPSVFLPTEFKLTHDLPASTTLFQQLKLIPVQELVHYGLEGSKAPPIQSFQGTHLEPTEYHDKMAQQDTVIIDVRNHYEANIGRFDPPKGGAKWLDPKMRKSTEFPVWLDSEQTRKEMKNKQVLMYCTGGIRCERASALLKYKMEHDPSVKDLNIQGVYQLQGGVDKYFKQFPEGGYWKGKNYVFDKRTAHAPAAIEAKNGNDQKRDDDDDQKEQFAHDKYGNKSRPDDSSDTVIMGSCEACGKRWDKYAGKRRCPTCGVPSL